MIVSFATYWIITISIFILLIAITILIKRATGKIGFSGIILRILALLALSLKLWMPFIYTVESCGKVKKQVLLFPVNSFGANYKMGADHCYINNETGSMLLIGKIENDAYKDSIPARSGKVINVAVINYFFLKRMQINALPNNAAKGYFIICGDSKTNVDY